MRTDRSPWRLNSRLMYAMCLWAIASPSQANQTNLTSTSATRIATYFCQSIGAPVSGEAATQFQTDTLVDWRSSWDVNFSGVRVRILDSNGTVCDYSDWRVGHRFDLTNQPEGQAINEDQAILRASAALAATGLQTDLQFSHATLIQGATPPKAGSHMWWVYWDRVFLGIPYGGSDGARVSLNAETGEINGLAVVRQTPPPDSANVLVSADAAVVVAVDQIVRANIQDAVPFSLEAEVVRPNARWLPGENEAALPVLPRIAWKLRFNAGDTYPVVYVDAETGKVIGGERGVPHGRSTPVDLNKLIRAAREMRVYRRAKNGTWPERPSSLLSDRVNSGLFAALRSSAESKANPPKTFADYKLVLIEDKKSPRELAYLSKSGLLGAGREWITVPEMFRKWLRDLEGK